MKTTTVLLVLALAFCVASASQIQVPQHKVDDFMKDVGDGIWKGYYTIYNFVNEKLYFYSYWPFIELYCSIMVPDKYPQYNKDMMINKCRNGAHEAIYENSRFYHYV